MPVKGVDLRTQEQVSRDSIRELMDEIRRTAPEWSNMPPWEAEKLFDKMAERKQKSLLGMEQHK